MSGKNKLTQAEKNAAALSADHLKAGIGQHARNGGLASLGGQLIRVILQIGSTAVMARLLSPEDFGLAAMALTVTFFFAMFYELGLITATVQSSSLTQEKMSAIFWINTLAGFAVFGVSATMAPLAALVYGEQEVVLLIILFSAGAIPAAISVPLTALLSRGMNFLPLQVRQIAAMLLSSALAIALAYWMELGALALAVQFVFNQVLLLVFTVMATPWRPSFVFSFKVIRDELVVARNMLVSNLAGYIHSQADSVLIGYQFGAATLGLFARAKGLAGQMGQITQRPLNLVMMSVLTKSTEDPERWRSQYVRVMMIGMLVNSLPCVLVYAASDQIISLLYGPQWTKAAEMLRWMLVAALSIGLLSPVTWAFVAQKRTQAQLTWSLVTLVCVLAACMIGAQWGAVEVAMAVAIAHAALTLIGMAVALRGTSVGYGQVLAMAASYALAAVAAVVAAAQAMAMAGDVASFVALVLAGAVAGPVFLGVVLALSFVVEGLALGRRELVSQTGVILSQLRKRAAR